MVEFETTLDHFSKRLEALSEQMQLMKKYGVNEDLLVAYMCHKLKISEKKARQIIVCYESFYGNFLKEGMVNDMLEKK